MMLKKIYFSLALLVAHSTLYGQSSYLPFGEPEYHLLDRLETKSGQLSEKLFLNTQPLRREQAVAYLLQYMPYQYEGEAVIPNQTSNALDLYNIRQAIGISQEWAPYKEAEMLSKKPWFNTFYKSKANFFEVNNKDFFLAVNPVISAQYMREKVSVGGTSASQNLGASSRGIELRGRIANKIGFYTYITDNQEQPNSYVGNWILRNSAVPGVDYFQNVPGSKTFDYMLARGYVDFSIVKKYLTMSMGYDKNFIGDGIRSLFLSDFSANSTFVKLNTRIWKLNYENIYSEIMPPYVRGADRQLPVKYSTTHYLSINATKWLNLGLFENVIFQRADHYSFGYMNPIIFFRALERNYGSPDNVNLGFSAKAIVTKGVQVYGQLFLDEFKSKELLGSNKWWGNKYGFQLGAKYFDAFTVKNLDLQAELNCVRPYAYSHFDSVTNYSHYNQPLAHPLGSGFREFIGLAQYQASERISLTGKLMYYRKGVDTGGLNYGNDIFRSYNTLAKPYGVTMINGLGSTCMLMSLNASYKIATRFYFDLGFIYRNYQYDNNYYPQNKSLSIYTGFRLNIARRAYDFM